MSEAEIRDRLERVVRPAFQNTFDPTADLARGRRRRRRNRAAGGTAACAAVAAVAALVVPVLPSGPGGSADSGDGVDHSGLTYIVSGSSVIHDGDREIDVSPLKIQTYVRTDGGFVFKTFDGSIYLADGVDVEQIGRADEYSQVVSDDSGSYVGWVALSRETVVYDTSRGVEVLRLEIGDAGADGSPNVVDIDGDVVYVRQGPLFGPPEAGLAWDFEASLPVRSSAALVDASGGYLAREYYAEMDSGLERTTRVIVSRNPDAGRPRFPVLEGLRGDADMRVELSPSGRYVLGDNAPRHMVIDRASKEDVTPTVDDRYPLTIPGYWIDDDRYVLWAYPTTGEDRPPYSLLICSVSVGTCELAAETYEDYLMLPF